jgi:hypothetical protein
VNHSGLERHAVCGRSLVVGAIMACLTTVPVDGQQGEVGTGGVKGTVKDSTGLPVEGAQIFVTGSALRGESATNGEFLLARASAGPLVIHVRRIGFHPDSTRVNVLAGTSVDAEITLRRLSVELAPVVVLGRREITGRMAGFYQRLARGHGHFFTREQVDRRNPGNMTDLFRMVPGVRVEQRGFNNQVRFRGGRCAPLTWAGRIAAVRRRVQPGLGGSAQLRGDRDLQRRGECPGGVSGEPVGVQRVRDDRALVSPG